MSLAQLTGLPIVPVSYQSGLENSVKSWDRFQIPLPFSRCEMIYGKADARAARSHRWPSAKNCGGSLKRSCAPSRAIEK